MHEGIILLGVRVILVENRAWPFQQVYLQHFWCPLLMADHLFPPTLSFSNFRAAFVHDLRAVCQLDTARHAGARVARRARVIVLARVCDQGAADDVLCGAVKKGDVVRKDR